MTRAGLQLDDVVLLGRTFAEYTAFFGLTDDTLRGARILDAASGVGSFGAEARGHGHDVVSADPVYGAPAADIERKCRADLDEVVRQLPAVASNYVWGGFYRDIPDLARHREAAYRRFVADYGTGTERYVASALPGLGFADKQFTLTLVSHFLFLYDDRLDFDFHVASLRELARITDGEVRVYPLVNLKAEPSRVLEGLSGASLPGRLERRPVPFEFLRGAREMLVLDTRA